MIQRTFLFKFFPFWINFVHYVTQLSTQSTKSFTAYPRLSTFSLHLMELRYRALYLFFSFSCTFFISTLNSSALTYLISTPYSFAKEKECVSFIFTNITEGFYAALNVSLMCTFFFFLPVLIYQFYSFLIPSCYQGERENFNLIIFSAFFLFLLSLYIAFAFLLPKICAFLEQFQYQSKSMEIKLQARIGPAVRWSCNAFIFTAIFFQTPVLLALLYNWGIVDCNFLEEKRKYVFFSLLLISSFLSPPDFYSQLALALGAFFIYELFLWSVLFHQKWIRNG